MTWITNILCSENLEFILRARVAKWRMWNIDNYDNNAIVCIVKVLLLSYSGM